MDQISANVAFICGLLLISVFATTCWRSYALRSYIIDHNGFYPTAQRGWVWETFVKVPLSIRPVKYRHHAFISFRRVPDGVNAENLATALRARGLEIELVNEPLESSLKTKTFVKRLGFDVGVETILINKLYQSAAVLVPASLSTFSSFWVQSEFALAMLVSNLVIILIFDDTPPERILPFRSPVFRYLLSAPVYAGRFPETDAIDGVTTLLNAMSLRPSHLRKDLIAAALAAAGYILASLLVYFYSGFVLDAYHYPGALLYLACVLPAISVVPCRVEPAHDELVRLGYLRLIRGHSLDFFRLYGMFICAMLVFFIPDAHVLVVVVILLCVSSPVIFELANQLPQMWVISKKQESR